MIVFLFSFPSALGLTLHSALCNKRPVPRYSKTCLEPCLSPRLNPNHILCAFRCLFLSSLSISGHTIASDASALAMQ